MPCQHTVTNQDHTSHITQTSHTIRACHWRLGMEILPPCAATIALNCAILSASAAAAADSLCASSSFLATCCLLRHSARFASLQGSQPVRRKGQHCSLLLC
jgi:hypothetical protein